MKVLDSLTFSLIVSFENEILSKKNRINGIDFFEVRKN